MPQTLLLRLLALLVGCSQFTHLRAAPATPLPRRLGSFNVKYPAFLALHQNSSATGVEDAWDLLISTFDAIPFSTDGVYLAAGLAKYLSDPSTIPVSLISTQVVWPNEIQSVPDYVFNRQMILSPNGFLVPFKTKGSLELFDIGSVPFLGPYKLTSDDDESRYWFYHRVIWKDMNDDGLVDAVTCRADKPIIGTTKGELLWLEQPATDEPYRNVPWKEHVISANGPDIFLRLVQLSTSTNTVECIITTGYFSQELTIFWTTDSNSNWTDISKVSSKVIGRTYGHFFDIVQVDLNGDGMDDLLVTNNDISNGQLLAFEMPDDFRTGNFTSHVLLEGLKPVKAQTGKGAPGSAVTFYPQTSTKIGKPLIALSGDDDGHVYILSPTSQDPAEWTYEVTVLQDSTPGTVGALAIGDVNNDGYNEIFVPAYNDNTVTAYTYGSTVGQEDQQSSTHQPPMK